MQKWGAFGKRCSSRATLVDVTHRLTSQYNPLLESIVLLGVLLLECQISSKLGSDCSILRTVRIYNIRPSPHSMPVPLASIGCPWAFELDRNLVILVFPSTNFPSIAKPVLVPLDPCWLLVARCVSKRQITKVITRWMKTLIAANGTRSSASLPYSSTTFISEYTARPWKQLIQLSLKWIYIQTSQKLGNMDQCYIWLYMMMQLVDWQRRALNISITIRIFVHAANLAK